MNRPYPIPRARLTAADLAGHRRRHDYDLPRERTIYLATQHGAGAEQRRHDFAEREALRSIDWGRPCVGPDDLDAAAAADAIRIQRRLASYRDGLGCEGSGGLPDDDREVLGLPTTDYGTLAGPAEGYAMRESRASVTRRRWLIQIVLVALAAALACGLVRVWLP